MFLICFRWLGKQTQAVGKLLSFSIRRYDKSCEANTSDVLSTNFLTSLLSLVLLFRFTKSLHNKYGYVETIVNTAKKTQQQQILRYRKSEFYQNCKRPGVPSSYLAIIDFYQNKKA